MSVYLGIDIGTSGTKTLAINEQGKILAHAMATYPCYHPKPLWSEQDPEDWWQATVKTVRAVVKQGQAEAGRCQSDRPFGPNARLGVPRQEQQSRPPGAAVERPADGGRMRGNREAGRRTQEADRNGRQSGTHRVHRARRFSGCATTSRKTSTRLVKGAAAEGRNSPSADRRICHRSQRRQRHAAARCGASTSGRKSCSASSTSTRACSRKCYESEEVTGKLTPRNGQAARPVDRLHGRRRRRRLRGRCGRQRHRDARACSRRRSAPPASSSCTATRRKSIRKAGCTRSATPCTASGT